MGRRMAYELVQDYLNDTRTLLQDTLVPFRYADSELIVALNATLLETRRLRADLFLGLFNTPSYDASTTPSSDLQSSVPIEEPFRLAIVHGIVAHALMRDQEDIQDARATMFQQVFNTMLLGLGAPGIRPPQPGGGK